MEVSWETITVKQFQLIYSVICSDRDDIDKQTAVLCLLLNTTPAIIEDMAVVDYNKLCQQTAFIFSKDIPGKPVQIIKASGKRYAIEYNPKKYKQRQYVETQHFLKGDTIANVTKLYINPLDGSRNYVNLPPITTWKDELVPTINTSSYAGTNGEINTVIAPIYKMKGDTMRVMCKVLEHNVSKQINIVLE